MENLDWAEGYGNRSSCSSVVHVDHRFRDHIPRLDAHQYHDLAVVRGKIQDMDSATAA